MEKLRQQVLALLRHLPYLPVQVSCQLWVSALQKQLPSFLISCILAFLRGIRWDWGRSTDLCAAQTLFCSQAKFPWGSGQTVPKSPQGNLNLKQREKFPFKAEMSSAHSDIICLDFLVFDKNNSPKRIANKGAFPKTRHLIYFILFNPHKNCSRAGPLIALFYSWKNSGSEG